MKRPAGDVILGGRVSVTTHAGAIEVQASGFATTAHPILISSGPMLIGLKPDEAEALGRALLVCAAEWREAVHMQQATAAEVPA